MKSLRAQRSLWEGPSGPVCNKKQFIDAANHGRAHPPIGKVEITRSLSRRRSTRDWRRWTLTALCDATSLLCVITFYFVQNFAMSAEDSGFKAALHAARQGSSEGGV